MTAPHRLGPQSDHPTTSHFEASRLLIPMKRPWPSDYRTPLPRFLMRDWSASSVSAYAPSVVDDDFPFRPCWTYQVRISDQSKRWDNLLTKYLDYLLHDGSGCI